MQMNSGAVIILRLLPKDNDAASYGPNTSKRYDVDLPRYDLVSQVSQHFVVSWKTLAWFRNYAKSRESSHKNAYAVQLPFNSLLY